MDFNLGNIYEHLDAYDKRVALSFVLSIPIAYVLCSRVSGGFLDKDVITRLAYTISLALAFMVANYFAIIVGQGMSQIYMPFRYMQLLLPQAGTLGASFVYGYTDTTHLSICYVSVLIIIVLVHLLFARFIVTTEDAEENKPKGNNKKGNKRRKRRK